MYVINQDYRVAIMTWFVWPLSSMREARGETRVGRSGFRFFLGVLFLAIGMFFWGRLAFVIADNIIGVFWINTIVAFLALALTSPILTAIAMPKHG
jgi:hypothetical protein